MFQVKSYTLQPQSSGCACVSLSRLNCRIVCSCIPKSWCHNISLWENLVFKLEHWLGIVWLAFWSWYTVAIPHQQTTLSCFELVQTTCSGWCTTLSYFYKLYLHAVSHDLRLLETLAVVVFMIGKLIVSLLWFMLVIMDWVPVNLWLSLMFLVNIAVDASHGSWPWVRLKGRAWNWQYGCSGWEWTDQGWQKSRFIYKK